MKERYHIKKRGNIYHIFFVEDFEPKVLLSIGYMKVDEPKRLFLSDRFFKMFTKKEKEDLLKYISEYWNTSS